MTSSSGKKFREFHRSNTASGVVKVHDGVISSIVRKSVLSVPGVLRLAGNSLVDNIAEIVGSKRIQDRAIAVSVSQDSEISVDVKVIVEYGICVPDIARKIQEEVSSSVASMTGMTVGKVNVMIYDLEEPSETGIE